MQRISLHDPVFQSDQAAVTQQHDYNPTHDYELHRPKTADLAAETGPVDDRPFTSASISKPMQDPSLAGSVKSLSVTSRLKADNFTGSVVQVTLSSNWGDPSYMGLTSIALLEAGSRQPIALRPDQLTLSLPGVAEGAGMEFEVSRLLDRTNLTTDADHMWVCPMPHPVNSLCAQCPCLTITLDTPMVLGGLRVWNYNVSMEDSYKGVKLFEGLSVVPYVC